MSNILVETLEEVHQEAANEMAGGYGDKLKNLVSEILDSCEAEDPQTDIAFQFEHLAMDLKLLQTKLSEAIAVKLAAKPSI
jgi:hypothetical protein